MLKQSRSVEKGMEILPPFDTPVGRVGMTICFDVSPANLIYRTTAKLTCHTATVSRDKPRTEAAE